MRGGEKCYQDLTVDLKQNLKAHLKVTRAGRNRVMLPE